MATYHLEKCCYCLGRFEIQHGGHLETCCTNDQLLLQSYWEYFIETWQDLSFDDADQVLLYFGMI